MKSSAADSRVMVPFQTTYARLVAAEAFKYQFALSRYKRAAAGSFEPGHSKRKSIWKLLLNEVKIFITLSSLQL